MSDNSAIPGMFARFSEERAVKVDLFSGAQLFLGLNCFEPGQTQPVHHHPGADKFYFVVSGKASVVVESETIEAKPGMLIWAPANVAHGVTDVAERTVIMVGIAPPPKSRQ